MKRFFRILASFISVGLISITSILFVLSPLTADAAYSYNPSDLISDPIFANRNSMTIPAIQAFLVKVGSGLQNKSFTESCSPSTAVDNPTGSYVFTYYPHCGHSETAATIIYDAGQAYGINPQAIMATMQKEQSLITDPSPSSSQLNCAMGYGSCSGFVGFFSQVDNGTWQLRVDIELMNGVSWWGYDPSSYPCANKTSLYSTGLYPGRKVTFADPGGKAETITIADSATAALYCYTPYVGPYSLTGYSGSYNFVQSFEQWWGSTLDDPVKVTTISNSSKSGGVAKVEFSLVTQPTANVTIPLSVSNAAEATLSGVTSITITPANWNMPANNAVNVTGLDDGVPSGDVLYYLVTGKPTSTDLAYGNLAASQIPDAKIYNVDYRPDEVINGGAWSGGKVYGVGLKRGNIYYLRSSNGSVASFAYGRWSDTPLDGDWNGDGKSDIGVHRSNVFYLNYDRTNAANQTISFGLTTDTPIVGDWNGKGKTEVGVRRGNVWYLDEGNKVVTVSFGSPSDTPITGDWNGDGKTDVGVRRGSTFYLYENGKVVKLGFGRTTDIPVTGDWNGDGKTDVGVRRGNIYYLNLGKSVEQIVFGRG